MKIAHSLPDHHWIDEMRGENPKDAALIQQKYIAEGLRAHGHSITLVAPQNLEHVIYVGSSNKPVVAPQTWTASLWFNILGKIVWKFQQFLRIPYLNFFSNFRRYDAYLQILPGHDVVLERNGLYNSCVAMACKKLRLPYVIFFDADQIAELDFLDEPLTGLLRWRAQRLLRYNLSIADYIVCVSGIAKTHLFNNWGVSSDKVIVLPNAVDIDRFKPDPKMRDETRALLHLTHHPLLFFIGNFYKWHDITTLLKAFAVVLKTYSDARLILVGDGMDRKRMIKLSTDLGVDRAVQFTGFIRHAEVSRYINAADITVVPVPNMKQEMWLSPMKLFEYMATGKAIVASAVGQISDVIKDGTNGLLVPAADEVALAEAISKLINNVPLRNQLGTKAREDAVQYHSWEKYLSRLENIFMDVLKLQ